MQISANKVHGQLLNSMEFSLGSSGYARVDSAWVSRDLSAPFNRLYLVASGTGVLRGGGEEYAMEPGTAYLLPAGLPCSYSCPEKMEKLFFHFNLFRPDRYDLLWGSGRIGRIPMPEGFLDSLLRCHRGESFLDAVCIQQGILCMATDYMRLYGLCRESAAVYSPGVADTIAYIRENLSARLRIDLLAGRRFVSRTHLTEEFRRETGITLGRYIDEQLMMEAQRRLSQTEATIGTISRDLGFCDQFYFSRRFTQLCGMPPQAYRQNIK